MDSFLVKLQLWLGYLPGRGQSLVSELKVRVQKNLAVHLSSFVLNGLFNVTVIVC